MYELPHELPKSLPFPPPCILESRIEIKVNLNFYFHTYLWYLKRFFEGLHKIFWSKEVWKQNFNLIFSLRPGSGREGLSSILAN